MNDQRVSHQQPTATRSTTSVLGDYLRFWSGRDSFRPRATPSTGWFLPLWGVSLAVAYASSIVVTIAVVAFGSDPPENAIGDLVESGPVISLILTAVVLAPLIEEVAFRLPMSLRPWHVAGGIGVLSVMFVPSLFGVSLGQAIVGGDDEALAAVVEVALTVGVIVVLGLILRRLLPRETNDGPALVPTRVRFGVIVTLTVVFAGAHLGNFAEFTWFLPAFILPQVLVGMVLAYVRVIRSWWMGVAIHALNNAVAVGFGLLPRLVGQDGGQTVVGVAIVGSIILLGGSSAIALGVNAYLTWERNQHTFPGSYAAPTHSPGSYAAPTHSPSSYAAPVPPSAGAANPWPHGRPPPWPPPSGRSTAPESTAVGD